jgi:hypothetical protein
MINRYYDYEYIELFKMFDEEELYNNFPYRISNPYLWRFMSWLLLKLIIVTNKEYVPDIQLFINYTTKTMKFQNAMYRLSNLWYTFIIPLEKVPLHIFHKSLHKQMICKWRLQVGR